MRLYCLRFLVALVTFGVGVATSSLLSSKRQAVFERQVVVSEPILVAAPLADLPPPPPKIKQKCLNGGDANPAHAIISGGVLNGKAISKPQPAYPAIGRAVRAEGTVVVQIALDECGNVRSAQALSGHPLLQAAAVAAARQAKFSPTYLSGQPVQVSGVVTYNFRLE